MRLLIFLLFDLILLLSETASAATGAPPTLQRVNGSVESLGSTWQAAVTDQPVRQALRIGAGRAQLQSAGGQVLASSGSALRIYQNEPDFQTGKFYLTGQVSFFSQKAHLSAAGQVRVDVTAPTRRVAVIAGKARISVGSKLYTLGAGQQYDFGTQKITAFAERDAWYRSQFSGEGEAVIEAATGPVSIQDTPALNASAAPVSRPVKIGEKLNVGQQLLTGASAWAEIGFTGGGYLRLQPQSALSVLSIDQVLDRTGRAKRQVVLKLLRGSAWNVVAKRQGGYEITTPTITTAVRGTVFRVDDSGLVKVFDGQVELPSSAGLLMLSGQERTAAGEVQPLVTDAADAANLALDAQRSGPIQLDVSLAPSLPDLALIVRSQPETRLSVQVAGRDIPMFGDAEGNFKLQASGEGLQSSGGLQGRLPEGRYEVTIRAERGGRQKTISRALLIDRTPPLLLGVKASRAGRVIRLSGQIQDVSSTVVLSVQVGGRSYTRILRLPQQADFDWTLPLPTPSAAVTLQARDAAGNLRRVEFSAGAAGEGGVGYAAP
ncbi:FecR family protein [Deinococcus psychrotolerans]|uniref:FecR family protein n=1 Tax=Deinococcus psychrotolerans TaxID=2489213 RepID=UPI0013DDD233|nr:FecR family protein [Deinococcus psychrotolerans]